MKFSEKELWTIYFALITKTGLCRANGINAKEYEKLADKIEKELLK